MRCFGKDVRIQLENGGEKRASEINPGDRLKAYGGKTVAVGNVFTGHDEKIYRITLSDSRVTMLSGTHPVLGEGRSPIAANKLKPNDKIMTGDGNLAEVLTVEEVPYNDVVYNFTFENEDRSVYVIADGIYAGDFLAQNETPRAPSMSDVDRDRYQKILDELRNRF